MPHPNALSLASLEGPDVFSPIYRMHAIITLGLYTFYPLFEVHLCTVTLFMVSIQEQFLIKSGL